MELLDKYRKIEQEILDYFGYEHGWRVYPISDDREYFWAMDEQEDNVYFSENEEIGSDGNKLYSSAIIGEIKVGKDFTMIPVDTQCDGNKFLMILDNSKKKEYDESLDDF